MTGRDPDPKDFSTYCASQRCSELSPPRYPHLSVEAGRRGGVVLVTLGAAIGIVTGSSERKLRTETSQAA